MFIEIQLIILSDEATDEITGVGGKTYLVIKHPRTKIATIIDKMTKEKEFVVIANEFHVQPKDFYWTKLSLSSCLI